jgi:hypothetical protein
MIVYLLLEMILRTISKSYHVLGTFDADSGKYQFKAKKKRITSKGMERSLPSSMPVLDKPGEEATRRVYLQFE